VKAGTILSSCR